MVFRSTCAALVLLAVVDASRRIDKQAKDGLSLSVSAAAPLTYNIDIGGVDNVDCGEGMQVQHVEVPWREMDESVTGAGSRSDCESCAGDLERRGILQPKWRCERPLFSSWKIRRDAEAAVHEILPTHSFNLTEADAQGKPLPIPVGTSPLPEALRGIFWLTKQNASSAIATFAGLGTTTDSKDCQWCSRGEMTLNGLRLMPVGDCHWAFATLGEGREIVSGVTLSGYGLGKDLKVVYDFAFDDGENPTFGHIRPIVNAIGTYLGNLLADQTWIAEMNMTLLTPDEVAATTDYPGSKIWRRRTSAQNGSVDLFPYDLTQIVDEDGNRIQPAWDAFVQYQQSEVAGTSPGILHYHGLCQ